MSDVKFFLQAGVLKQRGKPDSVLVRECYSCEKTLIDSKGKAKTVLQYGHVDESIMQARPAEYAKFQSYLAKNPEIKDVAKAFLNQPYSFDYEPKEVVEVKAAPIVVANIEPEVKPEVEKKSKNIKAKVKDEEI